ncbi:MAG: LamG domain-containing protein, partial [Phycisphaerae bacterium]
MVQSAFAGWMLVVGGLAAGGSPSLSPPADGVAFNGHTAYAVPVEALSLDPKTLTVAAWVNLPEVRESQVFMNVGKANTGFTFYLFGGRLRMLIGHRAHAYAFADADPPRPNAWTHCAGSFDGKLIRLYVNGRLVGTLKATGQAEGLVGRLFIGALNEHERFLKGRMDDLRIWRRALRDEEIAAVAAGRYDADLARDLAARWT